MTKPLKNYSLAIAFEASFLGFTCLSAAADPSTAILLLRADGHNAKRMQAWMVNDVTGQNKEVGA